VTKNGNRGHMTRGSVRAGVRYVGTSRTQLAQRTHVLSHYYRQELYI